MRKTPQIDFICDLMGLARFYSESTVPRLFRSLDPSGNCLNRPDPGRGCKCECAPPEDRLPVRLEATLGVKGRRLTRWSWMLVGADADVHERFEYLARLAVRSIRRWDSRGWNKLVLSLAGYRRASEAHYVDIWLTLLMIAYPDICKVVPFSGFQESLIEKRQPRVPTGALVIGRYMRIDDPFSASANLYLALQASYMRFSLAPPSMMSGRGRPAGVYHGKLKHLRELAGLTQEDLAEEAGLHVSTVKRAENGTVSKRSPEKLAEALSSSLNRPVSVKDLL